MSKPNDGGPVHPAPCVLGGDGYMQHSEIGGMTLRQWYAGRLQSTDPIDLTKAAGLYWSADNSVWSDASNRMGQFTDWWISLSITQRFDLIAKVRFSYADAMIRAEGGES